MTHTETPTTDRLIFTVTFGSYDDSYVVARCATEDEAKIAAAEHCLDMIERHHRMPDPFTIERDEDLLGALQDSLVKAQPEPAESLDDLRDEFARLRNRLVDVEAAITSAEADERDFDCCADAEPEPVVSPSDRDLVDALSVRVDALEQAAIEQTDEFLDMTGALVRSTAATLAIRAKLEERAAQTEAHWRALQHGKRGERWATARGIFIEMRTLLAEVDAVIGKTS